MFKLSKKHTRAKERTRPHGAECAICAKPRRYRRAKKQQEIEKVELGYDTASKYDLMIGYKTPNSF